VFKNTKRYTGYWLADELKTSKLEAGQRIKNTNNGPPYMVVCEQMESLIPTGEFWPNRLWRVCVIKLGDMSNTVPNVWYRRANEIELIEEIPVGMLFGPHGERILPLFSQVMELTSTEVNALHANNTSHSAAQAAYTSAWRHWNKNLKHPRSHTYEQEQGMTIASPPGSDRKNSPINYGFSLINDLVWRRARELDGENAFIKYIEDGQTEIELNEHWRTTSSAFLHKAMELSMAQYLSSIECEALTQLWSSVFGHENSKEF